MAHLKAARFVQAAASDSTSGLKVACKQWKRAEEISGG